MVKKCYDIFEVNDVELLQLRYFCDAAESQNFSKTAQKFMVPPSNISQTIRRLEKELGYTLFERRANSVSLNEEGKVFYAAAKQSLSLLDDVKIRLRDTEEQVSGEVRLQVFCNRRLVVDAIRHFHALYPEVSFVVNHGFPSQEKFDLIIGDDFSARDQYEKNLLLEEEIALAVSRDNQLSTQEHIQVGDLMKEGFILMHDNSSLYRLTQKVCKEAGFIPKTAIRCDDPFYIRQYVAMNLGVAFVPLHSWQGQMPEQIVCKRIEGLTRRTYIFHPKNSYMTKATAKFAKILTEQV